MGPCRDYVSEITHIGSARLQSHHHILHTRLAICKHRDKNGGIMLGKYPAWVAVIEPVVHESGILGL